MKHLNLDALSDTSRSQLDELMSNDGGSSIGQIRVGLASVAYGKGSQMKGQIINVVHEDESEYSDGDQMDEFTHRLNKGLNKMEKARSSTSTNKDKEMMLNMLASTP